MKILVIGDPHGSEKARKVPLKEADLILIPGDIGKADIARKFAFENHERRQKGLPEKKYTPSWRKKAFEEVYNSSIKLMKYYSKFAPVYVIFGNIENTDAMVRKAEKEYGIKLPYLERDLKKIKNVKIINNKVVKFKGLKIGGLQYFMEVSWVKEFKPSDYKERLKKARKGTKKTKKILNKFGKVDILLCHQPPYRILDKVNFPKAPKHWQGKHAGSKTILNYIKKKQPRYVFCGHIHEGKGKKKVGKTIVYNAGVAGDYVLLDID